jgi:hypothetical protein
MSRNAKQHFHYAAFLRMAYCVTGIAQIEDARNQGERVHTPGAQ